jgi:hypothetical protein
MRGRCLSCPQAQTTSSRESTIHVKPRIITLIVP